MPFRFIGQPFADAEQIGTIIAAALRNVVYDRAWIVTAWGKQSGLSRIAGDIQDFRERGGHIEVIVGVDEGGASTEGLRLAAQLFDAAYVFHDPGVPTFHPKIYAVQNEKRAVAVVGSGNLTKGGLYTNYEGSVAADLDLTEAGDRDFLASLRAYYERFAGLDDFCKPLNDETIQGLMEDPSVVVVSERRANKQRQARRGRGTSTMFGGSAVPDLLGAPPPSIDALPAEDEDAVIAEPGENGTAPGQEPDKSQGVVAAQTNGQPPAALSAGERPALVWWKKLSTSDAHRKPPTSHQRNGVTLNKARHDIDWFTWFRAQLFGGLSWSEQPMRNGGTKDTAIVPFEVFIEDRHLGQYNMRVDHAPARISGQGNTPTYLNWSGLLPEIKTNDYRGWWLELARMPDQSFRLRLTQNEPTA